MIPAFSPYMDILLEPQKLLWPELFTLQNMGFVLYGGTAVSLRLGHRHSVDFDFFTDNPLDKKSLRAGNRFFEGSTVLQEGPDTLVVLTKSAVKLSFFGGLDFGRVGEPSETEDGIMQVASLEDLMASKLKVLLQRVEAKDYMDIAVMLRSGVNLATGLASAKALYGASFQPSESLRALTFFKGGDLDCLSDADRNSLIRAVSGVGKLPTITVASYLLSSLSDGATPPPP
jgi:Nucleotidyl transferase AbiEii toxin, Type IV TA system